MKKINYIALFGLCAITHIALAEQVLEAALGDSRWILEPERLSCHLIHNIPGFGEARFSRYAGQGLAFALSPIDRAQSEQIRAVTLQFMPSKWQHRQKPAVIAELDLHAGRKSVSMRPALAELTLEALQNGKTPTFSYRAIQGGQFQTVAAISPANFGNVYKQFLKCQDNLPGVAGLHAKKFEVYFEKGSMNLDELAMVTLLDLKETLFVDKRIVKITLSGYTDTLGRPDENKILAEQRCKSVRDYLLENGVDKSKIEVKAFGERRPIGDNRTQSGRAKNRHVLISLEYE